MAAHRGSILLLASCGIVISMLLGCGTNPMESGTAAVDRSALPGDELTATRPFSDFLSAQGSTSLFFPPVSDYVGWANNNPQTLFALVDYAGLAATYLQNNGGPTLGTTVSGSVSEHRLTDGRAEVTVVVHAQKALSWAVACCTGDIGTDPPQFGYRASDLLADPSLTPGLSSVSMTVRFTNDAPGAPLPDLVDAFILGNATAGQQLKFLRFESSGTGPLRAAFGVPDGTPGLLQVKQTGVLMGSGQGALADGFPAERVELRVVGRVSAAP
jgi:hypothetical protein